MIDMSTQTTERDTLLDNYRKVRRDTELICTKLDIDDYQIQSIAETSPPKWHIAHVPNIPSISSTRTSESGEMPPLLGKQEVQ